ncbi:MAG: ferredoxin [Flavobacteriales bacterium]|nr:ferredoxin [Flavobacteriales bacterium]|tara:strand:- start:11 stop:337 length:327 start_codon:yes stop_codon:yes gene_type:complete
MSDINISVTDRDKKIHKIVAPTDMAMNLMELIKAYELAPEGTIGVCGGMAMCASCQCYITSDHMLPEIGEEEEAMLSEAFNVKENSRLGCQIFISEDLKDLAFEIAPE